ncbi:MAG: DUF4326 domain-containing protein [Deltaproteobacteria bacterium]|nr:DUF4326 domain-containing protein [Deltaproteobacteria bacterium]
MRIANFKNNPRILENVEAIYVGRFNAFYQLPQSVLANPFPVTTVVSREQSILKFRDWIRDKAAKKDELVLAALEDITERSILVCWCYPLPCHAREIWNIWKELRS